MAALDVEGEVSPLFISFPQHPVLLLLLPQMAMNAGLPLPTVRGGNTGRGYLSPSVLPLHLMVAALDTKGGKVGPS